MKQLRTAQIAGAPFPHLGAFESTKLLGSGTDILGTTRHIERWESDLEMLGSAGITTLRYSVPWHRIESAPGAFDFTWLDQPVGYLQRFGMTPILDPLHHISFPDWLTQGFADPAFPALYERFVLEVARRYPWVDHYTVFNEPLPTTLFCSYNGWWPPHLASDGHFVRMAINVSRAISRVSHSLRAFNPKIQFVHVDTCETHRAKDRRSEEWVRFANQRRFLMHDLITGRVDASSGIYPYLRAHGVDDGDLSWLQDYPAPIDVLGLDYYIHSEIEWYWDDELGRANISWPVEDPAGFARTALEYVERYRMPVLLSETNLKGSYLDRLTWLKLMEEQCESFAAQAEFRGFCWYPSIDSTDWCHLCKQAAGTVDPQGIWCLDSTRTRRHASELSDYYVRLARGQATSADLPAYEFTAETARNAGGYYKLMAHWPEWREQEILRAA